MQALTKAQEEIKALEGLRKKRLNKYQEALRKQAEAKAPSKSLSIHQLEEDRKKLQSTVRVPSSRDASGIGHVDGSIVADFESKHNEAQQRREYTYRSPTPSSPIPKKSYATSMPCAVPMSPLTKKELPPEAQKVKDEEEKEAKSNLAKLLDTAGEESIVVTGFRSIRKRYLNAIEACRPSSIDVSNSLELEAAKKRRAARRQQALKKDRMGKIQRAWDNYEGKAQDRPSVRDNEEMLEEEKVANIEAEVNNAWISYAKQVAVEAAEEEDDDDLEYWIAEAKRLKAEAEARRLARLRALEERLRSEEDEYWIEEALKLRAKHKNKGNGPFSADNEVDQDEEMVMALQLRAKHRKVYQNDYDDDRLEGKQFKKGRIYGPDSDSDEHDEGGATFQKKQPKKKSFGHDDDTEGLASKVSKKGRVYRNDSESDSDDVGGASMQRKTRKQYGVEEDGALSSKLKKKSHERGQDDEDSEDGRPGLPSLSRKQGIHKKRNDSVNDSNFLEQGGDDRLSSNQSNESNANKVGDSSQTTHRKSYGKDDCGNLNAKLSKKGRGYSSDSDSDAEDEGTATHQRRKDYGAGSDDKLAAKQKKKGQQDEADSDSDVVASKQQRKKYDEKDDGELPKKGRKKRSQFDDDSDSDSEDIGTATHQRRKDYGTGSDDKLAAKQKKKGQQDEADSDSDVVASKQQRKKYDQNDDGELPKKGRKKGSQFDDDSDSDSEDIGTATHQRRKDYGTGRDDKLAANQKKKGQQDEADSDSDVVTSKQQRKKYEQSDDGEIPKKGRKKGFQFDDDSESVSGDEGETTHQRRKDYGPGSDDKLAAKLKKKTRNCASEADSDVGSDDEDAEPGKTADVAQVRRKNYGRSYSGDGLPTKEKKKKTMYLSENSDAQDDNVKRPVRRRKKNFGGDTVADEDLPTKNSQKSSKFVDSDSSSCSSSEEETSMKISNDVTSSKPRTIKKKSYSGSSSDSDHDDMRKSKKKVGLDDSDESDDEERGVVAAVNRRRKSYVDEDDDDDDCCDDAKSKVKRKKEFVPMSDSDDDYLIDGANTQKEPRKKGITKRQTTKINDSQSSFRLCSESQQSLNASFVGKGDASTDTMNYDNSVPHSKFYKSEYFDCPSESSSSEGEASVKKMRPKKSSSKKAIKTKEEDEVLGDQPTNPDGSPWNNPLKGWTNSPKKKILSKGARLILKVPVRTECWRKTNTDKVVDTAPFHWQKITGDFRIQVKLSGNFSANFQKAGIMLRLDNTNWLLSGMEFFNNRIHHSTCVTLDHTDWSLCQLPYNAEIAGVWFSVKRIGGSYECHYSYDAKKWVLTRQGSFTERPVLYVGICGVNPTSDDLRASFDYYRCQTGGYLM